MKFPNFPRKGDSVEKTVSDILRYLRSITIRSVDGGAVSVLPGGTDIKIDTPPNSAKGFDAKPNLWVSQPFNTGTDESPNWKVIVTDGYLKWQHLLDGPVAWDTPTINDVSIEARPREQLAISGAGWIYLHFTTTNRGVPNLTPTIDFYTSEQTSTHHVPESTANTDAAAGDYYFPLATIEATPDTSPTQYRIKRRFTGDVFIPNQLDRLKNVGDKIPLYWGFDVTESFHKIRSLQNAADTGGVETLLKELGAVTDETVKLKGIKAGERITLSASDTAIEITADDQSYTPPASSLRLQVFGAVLTIDFTGTTADFELGEDPDRYYYRDGVWSTVNDGLGYDHTVNVIGSIGLVVT